MNRTEQRLKITALRKENIERMRRLGIGGSDGLETPMNWWLIFSVTMAMLMIAGAAAHHLTVAP